MSVNGKDKKISQYNVVQYEMTTMYDLNDTHSI